MLLLFVIFIFWLMFLAFVLLIVRCFSGKGISLPWTSFSQLKGLVGEKAVSTILATLPQGEYRVVNNVMIKTESGTSQIDHIVVSRYGIFVIETKNYKGWIIGSEYANQWTKNRYGKKYSFYNPIKQNYGHVKVLENYLGLPFEVFVPIVAFSRGAELKVNVKSHVIYMAQLPQLIQEYKVVKIGWNEIDTIVNKIINANIDNNENRKQHIQAIRTNIAIETQKVREGICPKCNGKLVRRNGKYGMFWGCSNYPKCRYTKK